MGCSHLYRVPCRIGPGMQPDARSMLAALHINQRNEIHSAIYPREYNEGLILHVTLQNIIK